MAGFGSSWLVWRLDFLVGSNPTPATNHDKGLAITSLTPSNESDWKVGCVSSRDWWREEIVRPFDVIGIDVDGTISLRANAESRAELRPFLECLRQAVRSRVERRRQAGEPVPPAHRLMLRTQA